MELSVFFSVFLIKIHLIKQEFHWGYGRNLHEDRFAMLSAMYAFEEPPVADRRKNPLCYIRPRGNEYLLSGILITSSPPFLSIRNWFVKYLDIWK